MSNFLVNFTQNLVNIFKMHKLKLFNLQISNVRGLFLR